MIKVRLIGVMCLIGLTVKGQSSQREVTKVIELPKKEVTSFLIKPIDKPIRWCNGIPASCISFKYRILQINRGEYFDRIKNDLSDYNYYVDGVRVIGYLNIPKSSLDQVQILRGSLPAEFGGFEFK